MSKTPDQLHNKIMGHRQDALGLIAIIIVASTIGIYMNASTVLISKDGVFYLDQARLLERDSATVLKGNTPGYPMLLFAVHKVVGLFGDNSSLFGWIYTAQAVTLLCRILALVPLYLIGKRLVGSKNSFYATLILIMLPHPAHMSCELTREWPYVLFLAAGLLLLLRGAAQSRWWMFGIVGLAAGLSHIIRPEGAQLVMFAFLWLSLRLIRPGRDITRAKICLALVALMIGFAIPVGPYAKARGRIIPDKLRELISNSYTSESKAIPAGMSGGSIEMYTRAGSLGNTADAVREFIEKVNENLLYFFVPPFLVGLYLSFRNRPGTMDTDKFFITAFFLLNITMPILLHCKYDYMSRRHAFPFVLLGIFYVPSGLRAIGNKLDSEIFRHRTPTNKNSLRWYSMLLIIGLATCVPKFLQPAGADRRGYRNAAEWLKKNTDTADVVAVSDPRISFYAERKGLSYENEVPGEADYVVIVTDSSGTVTNPTAAAQEVYSVGINRKENNRRKVVIYRIMEPTTDVGADLPTLFSEDDRNRQKQNVQIQR